MAITRQLPDGRTVVLEGGRWRLATEGEQAAGQMSGPQAWASGLLANAGFYAGAIDTLARANAAFQSGQAQPQTALGDFAQQMEPMAADVAAMHPTIAPASRFWADPFQVAGTVGLVKPAGALAKRVAQRIGAMSRQTAAALPVQAAARSEAARLANLDEMGLPVSTAGAAQRTTPRSLWGRLTEEFSADVALTDQQKAARLAVESGKVKFQPLPGQLRGSRLMNSGIKSNPVWLSEFEPERVANYRELTGSLKAAMGLDEAAPFTDEILDMADDVIGAKFEVVQGMVQGKLSLPKGVEKIAEPFLTGFEKELIDLAGPLTPEQFFQVRSALNASTRKLARDGDITGLRAVVQALGKMDDVIEASIGDTGMSLWQEAKNQYRVKLLVEAANVVSPQGAVNIASANRVGRQIFGKQYRGFGPRKGLPQATVRALDNIKVASAFPDAVGNSGTPERLAAMEALRSPVSYSKDRLIGKAIRWMADQGSPPPMVTE